MRGADPIELSISEMGWLIDLMLLTTDCYGTVWIEFQGADLETRKLGFNPESGVVIGSFAQDPGGWISKYYRPNPASTAGIYAVCGFSGGYQGTTWPYVPTIKMTIEPFTDSTQPSAYIATRATTIAITDRQNFIRSLRSVIGAPVIQKIDPALMAIGPEPLRLEGPQEQYGPLMEKLDRLIEVLEARTKM